MLTWRLCPSGDTVVERGTCPVVGSSEEIYRWRAWRPRLSGANKETGEPTHQSEFAPVSGAHAP